MRPPSAAFAPAEPITCWSSSLARSARWAGVTFDEPSVASVLVEPRREVAGHPVRHGPASPPSATASSKNAAVSGSAARYATCEASSGYAAANRARRAAGSSGRLARMPSTHSARRLERRQVRLGEVAVVERELLRPHGRRGAGAFVEVPRLLDQRLAAVERGALALLLEPHGPVQRADRVQVLDLDLGAELGARRAAGPRRSRRSGATPPPSGRRTRPGTRGRPAARSGRRAPPRRCACRARRRSRPAARPRGCSRPASSRRRRCDRSRRRAWTCRCPPPCARG